MTVQTLGIGKIAYPRLAPAQDPTRALDRLDAGNIAKKLVVFTPGGDGVESLVAEAERKIGGVAALDIVQKIVSFNPDNLWAIARKSRYDCRTQRGEGFVAFLMLNAKGLDALMSGTLDGTDPDLDLLAAQNEKPAAIYVWALFAPGVLSGGVPLVFEKISSPLYQDVTLYARPVTASGRQFLETLGFKAGAKVGSKTALHLHTFARGEGGADRPSYDTYRRSKKAKGVSVTVARSVEDLSRVMAVRSSVYISEQECPYEEEFDGNDLSATHLLGYSGNEPAACLRIRFFADFAKLERVAVRREFRQTRLSFELVKAAIELARVKGYRRLYGHARKDLVHFWTRFGFRTFEGGGELVFSDYDYVEMVLEMDRHPDAITIGIDPYVIIRPEGRWHEPSVLERSTSRPVTRPSFKSVAI